MYAIFRWVGSLAPVLAVVGCVGWTRGAELGRLNGSPLSAPSDSAAASTQHDSLCIVRHGALVAVEMGVDTITGDTLAGGVRLVELARDSTAYAAGLDWFETGEPISLNGYRYQKGGPALPMPASDIPYLERAGTHRGLPLFREKPTNVRDTRWVLFLPARPPCVFTPYYYYR